MDEQKAFQIIASALDAANKGQRFSLGDSNLIFQALQVFAERYAPEEEERSEEDAAKPAVEEDGKLTEEESK